MNAPAKSADATRQADAVLAFFFDLEGQIDRAVFFIQMAIGDVGIVRLQLLEISQLVQPLQADFPQPLVVNLAFFQNDFAADNFVAGRGIARKFNTPHVELLAFVYVNLEENQLLVFVESRVRDGREVDVALSAVGFAQSFQAFGNFVAVENIAILDGKNAAQRLHIVEGFIVLESDSAQSVSYRLRRPPW